MASIRLEGTECTLQVQGTDSLDVTFVFLQDGDPSDLSSRTFTGEFHGVVDGVTVVTPITCTKTRVTPDPGFDSAVHLAASGFPEGRLMWKLIETTSGTKTILFGQVEKVQI